MQHISGRQRAQQASLQSDVAGDEEAQEEVAGVAAGLRAEALREEWAKASQGSSRPQSLTRPQDAGAGKRQHGAFSVPGADCARAGLSRGGVHFARSRLKQRCGLQRAKPRWPPSERDAVRGA